MKGPKNRIGKVLHWITEKQFLIFRISIAVIFVWFGLLKVMGASPVESFVKSAFPIIGPGPFFILGLFEVLIGLGFLAGKYLKFFAVLLVIHMLGTFLVFLVKPSLLLAPSFPFLTFEGEFIVKNLALIAIGLVVASKKT